jgi:hypothetical protein
MTTTTFQKQTRNVQEQKEISQEHAGAGENLFVYLPEMTPVLAGKNVNRT